MTRRLENKVALVTGGSSGIGRASSLAFAREGAKVVIADINVAGGEETVKMIRETGGEATFVRTDVTKASEVEAMVDAAVKAYGRLDCALNNAGGGNKKAGIVECTEENWDSTVDLHLKAVWLGMKYEIPQMLKGGGGSIVNTASVLGLVALDEGLPAYIASKHGVIGLTKAAAVEYSRANIRVNAVCPASIRSASTDQYLAEDPSLEAKHLAVLPIGRRGKPMEVAEAVVWLCSDAASFVVGCAMTVDGGYTIH